ncbi:MAG: beta-1,6-N-acetylglucosaminyltransferase [Pseudomonadota bacterium]
MSGLGVIILAHQGMKRVEQMVRYYAHHSVPVVVHIDKRCGKECRTELEDALADIETVDIFQKFATPWGKFGLIQASLLAAKRLLHRNTEVSHVLLSSGACVPLRPVSQFQNFLSRNPYTDFIESVDLKSHAWVQDGLSEERFDYFFPFSWKKSRLLFDAMTAVQRGLTVKRSRPVGLKIHLGSQWWCLTRATLNKILNDPNRRLYDRYFRHSWIPDESYFQSLARIHSERLEARSLTWSKFDNEGIPFTLYADHLEDLEMSNHFMMRKAWAKDDALYERLLNPKRANIPLSEGDQPIADRQFASAIDRTSPTKDSHFNAGRYTKSAACGRDRAPVPYTVIFGPQFLFDDLDQWIERNSNAQCQKDLFDRSKIQISDDIRLDRGNLLMSKLIRNNAPKDFLHNFITNQKERRQVLFFDSLDSRKCFEPILRDSNATVFFTKEAWIAAFADLIRTGEDVRSKAANLQRTEEILATQFTKYKCKADVRQIGLSELVKEPFDFLNEVLKNLDVAEPRTAIETPKLRNISEFHRVVQRLTNDGFAIDLDPTVFRKAKSESSVQSASPKLVEK